MVGCSQKVTDSELTIKKCVVDTIIRKGQHSSIEPDIIWEVRTDCGVNIISRQGYRYLKGDTITIFTKKYYEKGTF